MTDVRTLIEQAVERFGSEAKLAAEAGVSQPMINQAKRSGRVGPKLALGLHKATNGEIPRWVTRPDLWDAPNGGAAE